MNKLVEKFLIVILCLVAMVFSLRKLLEHEKAIRDYRFICYVYSYSKDGETKNVFLTNDDWAEKSNLIDNEGSVWQIERFPRYKCIERMPKRNESEE